MQIFSEADFFLYKLMEGMNLTVEFAQNDFILLFSFLQVLTTGKKIHTLTYLQVNHFPTTFSTASNFDFTLWFLLKYHKHWEMCICMEWNLKDTYEPISLNLEALSHKRCIPYSPV